MISRYILIAIGIISLIWIVFVGVNLIDDKQEYSLAYVFGKNDGRVLVINKLEECDLKKIVFKTTPQIGSFLKNGRNVLVRYKMIVLSELQNQLIIEKKDNWTKSEIFTFFQKMKIKVEFKSRFKFIAGNFMGVYHSSSLHLFSKNIILPKSVNSNWLVFDKRASASLITFKNNSFFISDIYNKSNNVVQYISEDLFLNKGKQINDENLFSIILPRGFSNYHFFEKHFYSNYDRLYLKSPLYQWVDCGFVEFDYNGENVIITDLIDGEDPFEILNEFNDDSERNSLESEGQYKKIRLTKKMPKESEKGFFIFKFEGYTIIANSKEICQKIKNEYKQNDSIQNKNKRDFFLNDLPNKVSERFISDSILYTKSVYKNKLFETKVKIKK